MKKVLVFVAGAALFFGIVTNACAIQFGIDKTESSVALSNLNNWGSSSVTALLASGLEGDYDLDYGKSQTFDFFTLSVDGLGFGTADIAATLAFDDIGSITGSGSGWYLSLCGIFSGGKLTWNDLPQNIYLDSGDYFKIDFEDIFEWGIGDSTTVSATITAYQAGSAAPVPEPATMLLFGCGLIGLAVVGRKKFHQGSIE